MDKRTYEVFGIYDKVALDSQDLIVVRTGTQLARQLKKLADEGKLNLEDLRVYHLGFYEVTDSGVCLVEAEEIRSWNADQFISVYIEEV